MKNQLILMLAVLVISFISFSDLCAQSAEEDAPTQQQIEQTLLDEQEAAEQEAERLMNEERIKEIAAFDAERKKTDQEIINRANADHTIANKADENKPPEAKLSPAKQKQVVTQKTATKKRSNKSKKKRN